MPTDHNDKSNVSIYRFRNLVGSAVTRTSKSVLLVLIGGGLGRLFSLCAGLIAARLLEPVGFGQLTMVRSTVGVFALFAGMGLGVTATRFVAKYKTTEPREAGEIIGLGSSVSWALGSVMALTVLLFSPYLAVTTLGDNELSMALRLSTLIVLFGCLAGLQEGVLAGLEDFRSIAIVAAVEGASLVLLSGILVYYYKFEGAIIALGVSQAAKYVCAKILVTKRCRHFGIAVTARNWRTHYGLLWQYALPAFIAGVLWGPVIWAFNRIVVSQEGGYEILGLMAIADQWKTMILFLPAALGTVVMPALASTLGQHGRLPRRSVWTNIMAQAGLAVLGGIVVAFASPLIIRFYGASYSAAASIITFIGLIAVLHAVGNAAGNAVMAQARVWGALKCNALWGFILLLGAVFLVPAFGLWGVFVSYLVAQLVHAIVLSVYAANLTPQS